MIPAAIQNVGAGIEVRLQVYRHRNRTSQEGGANVPLPTTAGLAGLTLQVQCGQRQAYPCILVYAAFEEVGAILPSNVPLGDGQLTLYYTNTNGTVTAGPNPPIRVVPVASVFIR